MIGKTITEVARGDHAEIVRTVQDQNIADFIEAVGDVNPLHADAEEAQRKASDAIKSYAGDWK